ncbi:MAG: putative integrase [Prokaryotic dsDNA virus sp.]|nr:MAG: putative integrase [Prokaryotic dsDNA virus sp.]|tara:strand:+ start:3294 stop:4382 length:1089 start_codon:yes stop_codon:yes gene_type:complete
MLEGRQNIEIANQDRGTATYYYRYTFNGARQRIYLGNSSTPSRVLERAYEDAIGEVYALKRGFVAQKPVQSKPIYLGKVLTRYKNKVNHPTKTFHEKFYEFKHFILFFGKESDWDDKNRTINPACKIDLRKIKTSHLNNFYTSEVKKGKSESTINGRKKYLAPFYRWMVGEQILDRDHHSFVMTNKKAPKKTFEYQALEYKIIKQAIKIAPSDFFKHLWSVMAYTGLDPVDAISLNKDDSINHVNGDVFIITKRTKTKITAQVPLFPELAKLKDGIFNLNKQGTIRNSNVQFKKAIDKLGIVAKDNHKIAQKCIRHSFMTHCLQNGVKPSVLKDWVGHVSEKMQRTYKDLNLTSANNHNNLF